MNTLIIDCSNGLYLSLLTTSQTLEFSDENSKKQSDSLLDKIDQLLNQANISVKDISVIAVCVGPGSFTGIRVAISTAKGLAVGTNAKVITFNSFDCISAGLSSRNYGIIVEGFGTNYYYYFKKYGKIFKGCDQQTKLEILAKDIVVYSASDKVISSITAFNVVKAEYSAVLAVKDKINNGEFVQTNQIAPLYLRASQAEIERLKNENKK